MVRPACRRQWRLGLIAIAVALTGCGPRNAPSSATSSNTEGPAPHLSLAPTVTLVATLKQPDTFAPAAVAFRPDGDLITADQHGNAYAWNIAARRATEVVADFFANALAFSQNGSELADADADGSALVWKISR